jgi:hypothetical protein
MRDIAIAFMIVAFMLNRRSNNNFFNTFHNQIEETKRFLKKLEVDKYIADLQARVELKRIRAQKKSSMINTIAQTAGTVLQTVASVI